MFIKILAAIIIRAIKINNADRTNSEVRKSESNISVEQLNEKNVLFTDFQISNRSTGIYIQSSSIDISLPVNITEKKMNLYENEIIHALSQRHRSQDYIDGRLYRTPLNVAKLIKEKGKLLNKCLISINHNSILFDCNYEQLTLILEILEHSIQFYPLTMSNNNPIYSNQIILPNFGTHSYMFSFNLVSDLLGLITGSTSELQHISDKSNYLLDIISENKSISRTTLQNQLKELKFRNLLGYTGIYVNIIPNSQIPQTEKLGTVRLFFYVSEEFTQNSLILDRAGIMKSSLVLLSYVLTIYSKNSTNIDNEKIDQLLKDISVYTTSEYLAK